MSSESYLLDNSVFSPLIAADAEAVKFALRNRLYVEKTVLTEAEQEHSPPTIERTISDFGIVEAESAQESDIAWVTTALAVTVVKPDIKILAAAQKHRLGLVTGDNKLFRRAVRLKYTASGSHIGPVKFRLFVPALPLWQRVRGYRNVRKYIQNHFPNLNLHRFTGGS